MPDSADKKLLKDNSPPKPYPSPQISSFHLPSSPQIPLVSSRFVSSPPPKFHSLARSPPPSNFVVSSPLLPPNFVCLVCPAPLPQFRWPRLPSSPRWGSRVDKEQLGGGTRTAQKLIEGRGNRPHKKDWGKGSTDHAKSSRGEGTTERAKSIRGKQHGPRKK